MPKYVVTVGYEWTTVHFRQVEVTANDVSSATATALERVAAEPQFWCAAQEMDGEASPTSVLAVSPQR